MALGQLRLHQIVGNSVIISSSEVFVYLFPDPVFLRRSPTKHARTRAHTSQQHDMNTTHHPALYYTTGPHVLTLSRPHEQHD